MALVPRFKMVNFRVTPEEFDHLRAKADVANLSVSEYVRTAILVTRQQVAMENRVAALEEAVRRIAERRRIA